MLTLIHLMLFLFQHDEGVQHIEFIEQKMEVNDKFVRSINNGEDQSHNFKTDLIFTSPEPIFSVKVFFEFKWLSFWRFSIFLLNDSLREKSFQNLWAVDLSYNNIIIGQIIKSWKLAGFD